MVEDNLGRSMSKIIIDKENCKACKICMALCPKQLIFSDNAMNSNGFNHAQFKDNNECVGCAICAQSCPDAAITKVYKYASQPEGMGGQNPTLFKTGSK